MKEALALLALMTLSHIVEHQGNLAPLIEVSIDWSKNQEIFSLVINFYILITFMCGLAMIYLGENGC